MSKDAPLNASHGPNSQNRSPIRPRGYKTFSMLNSAEHKIYQAYKFLNGNNWLAL